MSRWANRSLDPLATQRDSGHDQRVTDANAQPVTTARLRLVRLRPQLLLAFPDEMVQDAGVGQ